MPAPKFSDSPGWRNARAGRANAVRWHGPESEEAREAAARVNDWAAIITARAIVNGTTPLGDDARREIIAIFRGIRDARERDAG